MHNYKILIIIIVLITLSHFRILGQQAWVTSGKDVNGVGGSVAYSIGQVDYTNFSSDSGRVSLGVQQPLVIIMVGTDEPKTEVEFSAFPNPVTVEVNLKLEVGTPTQTKKNFSYGLYDINGKLLASKEIKDITTIVTMKEFVSGMYLLRVTQNGAEVKTFKIFKTN